MKRVLFVDDEPQILKSIRRIFAGSAFEVLCADSGASALSILAQQPVDMIVSDMRMPNMDGVELLGIVKQEYPDTIRFILSGYSDEEEIMGTLKNNIAKAYIFKPWDNNELKNVITRNLESTPALPGALVSFINNKNQLPTTTLSYQRIHRAIEECRDFDAVSAEVAKDQAISAKVLQIVNSAYYGIRTGSVTKALSFLGIGELQRLIRSAEVMDSRLPAGRAGLIAEKLWAHASLTSQLQQLIQDRLLPNNSDASDSAAGLLHKIGIVLMLNYDSTGYIDFLIGALAHGGCLRELEKRAYGYSHTDVSAFLLKWWNLPAEIVEAAAHYTSPLEENVTDRRVCCCVHIAQHYAARLVNLAPFCALNPNAFTYIGLDRAVFEEQYERFAEQHEQQL